MLLFLGSCVLWAGIDYDKAHVFCTLRFNKTDDRNGNQCNYHRLFQLKGRLRTLPNKYASGCASIGFCEWLSALL